MARVYELGARACAELAARAFGDVQTSEQQTAAAQKLRERLDGLIARLTGVIPPLVRASRAAGAAECSRIGGSGDAGLWEMRGGNGKRARTVITPPTPAEQSRYSPRAAIARTRKRSYARDRRRAVRQQQDRERARITDPDQAIGTQPHSSRRRRSNA